MTVDTLSIAQALRAAELSPAQAEAIASAITKALSESAVSRSDFDLSAAKRDADTANIVAKLDSLEKRLMARIDASDDRTAARIEAARASLLIWVVGVLFAFGGIGLAFAKL